MIKKIFALVRFYWLKLRPNVEQSPVTATQCEDLIKRFKHIKYSEVTDRYYVTADLKIIKSVAIIISKMLGKYVAEDHDCDNYAMEFKAIAQRLFPRLPIAYCHVVKHNNTKHALNMVVYINNIGKPSLTYIEPQTGEVVFFAYEPYMVLL